MKRYLICFSLLSFGCQGNDFVHSIAALEWSQSESVLEREEAFTFHHLRSDGSSVIISTAILAEEDGELTYSAGMILERGFVIYPGGIDADDIDEAIRLANRNPGAHYK